MGALDIPGLEERLRAMSERTYVPVGDLPAGTRFRGSREYSDGIEYVILRQVEDFAQAVTADGQAIPKLFQCNTAVWPLSDFARSPTD